MGVETIRTADGRVLTEVEAAVHKGIADRLSGASLHWGTEQVSPDAWPHIAIAATAAAQAAIRAQIVAEVEAEWTKAATRADLTGYRTGLSAAARIARGES